MEGPPGLNRSSTFGGGLKRMSTRLSLTHGPRKAKDKALDLAKGTWARFLDDEGYEITGHGLQELDDGAQYIGQYKNGRPEGVGRMEWANGVRVYAGAWKKGIPNGQGMMMEQTALT